MPGLATRGARITGRSATVLCAVVLLALSGCGGADMAGGSTPSSSAAHPQDGEVHVEVSVTGDEVTTADDRVEVEVGQTVRIAVTCDVAEEVHVHGFDLMLDVEPGVPGQLEFQVTPDPGPGLYEVELEGSGLLLFQLEVR